MGLWARTGLMEDVMFCSLDITKRLTLFQDTENA